MARSWYENAGVKDFLENDSFVQWVIRPTPESNVFWEDVMRRHPGKIPVMNEAAAMIRLYRLQDTDGNELHRDDVWQRISNSLSQQQAVKPRVFRIAPLLRIAAAVVLIVAGVAVWQNYFSGTPRMQVVTTGYGEVKTITLPDNSTVTINGNSTVRYAGEWKTDGMREVWIDGEAYFNVLHLNRDTTQIKDHERFVVHSDDIDIEVLGTTFNVKARRGKTNVALLTGKIRIDYKDEAKEKQPTIMAPGDYIEYERKQIVVNKKLEKPLKVTTWKSNELAFTDATLKEIAETLQDSYGYTVVFADTSIAAMKIEGDISVNSVTDLLDVVGTTLDVNIEQSAAKHIVISR